MIINKLYEETDRNNPEVKGLINDISSFARKNKLEYNKLKWFEYSYFLLHSGHRQEGIL